MSLVVRKLPLAEQDALDAAVWYEQRRTGLGDEFLDEVDRAVRALGASALHHRIRFSMCVGRQSTGSGSTGFITLSEIARSGYWRSSTDGGIRGYCRNALRESADPTSAL